VTRAKARILLSLFLLSISTSALADERTRQKPEDWDARLEMLRAVPYIDFSEVVVDEGDTGVVFYDPEKAYDGYNFYCTGSAGGALLLDMYGRVVHRWAFLPKNSIFAGHAIVLENGDLVVIKKFEEMFRLNWGSKLIWKKKLDVHHDVTSAPDGSFYVIVLEFKDYRGLRGVMFDALVHMTEDGEEIDRWSTYDHLDELKSVLDTRSFLDTVLDSLLSGPGEKDVALYEGNGTTPRRHFLDYFHMNTINLLPGTFLAEKDSRFQRGNLLVCFRNVNQIAVLEKDTYRVLWAWGEGELQLPHHPTMLESGHILIFDNGGERKYSRVVELDPVAEAIVWEYTAEPPEDFYSRSRGSAQRLPNGNTLICESNKGRAFEVTEEGEVVWVWLNPALRGKRRETVYRMMRLPSAQVDEILRRWWWE